MISRRRPCGRPPAWAIVAIFGALAAASVGCSSGGGTSSGSAGTSGGGGGANAGRGGSGEAGRGGSNGGSGGVGEAGRGGANGGIGGSADGGSGGANAGRGGSGDAGRGGSDAGRGGSAGAGRGGAASAGRGGSASAGSGGTAGGGGAGGGAGRGGAAGTGGATGGAGTGGRPAGTCTFDVTHAPSPMIGTVEIVTFTLDEPTLTDARIEFGPSGAAPTMTAPVDLPAPLHRTLLLGMKAAKTYTFRIVATAGAKTCTSPEFSFTTGALPAGAPTITKSMSGTGGAKGFIVTTVGVDAGMASGQPDAYIFDTDGDIVWWTYAGLYSASANISRAHMSWDGKTMWIMTAMSARIISVSMDGQTITDYSSILKRTHHDFAVLPEGGIAALIGSAGATTGHSIVEMRPDGTQTTIVADLATLYQAGFYPNAIHYTPADDSYTLGDRDNDRNLFIKFRRNGTLVWQLGGSNPLGKSFALVGLTQWTINHGHHLTPDGRFLFFNNGSSVYAPKLIEVMLDETNNTATKTWEYALGSQIALALGDAERLPNGNALATSSMAGYIAEVNRSGAVVQSFRNISFGYADFRTSLYGPPPR